MFFLYLGLVVFFCINIDWWDERVGGVSSSVREVVVII